MPPSPPTAQSFATRAQLTELMDEPTSYEELRDCLHDLERVNRVLSAYRPTLQWLRQFSAPQLHIVDVGCGGGDMLRRIEEWARRRLLTVQLTGIDLNPYAQARGTRIHNSLQPHSVGHFGCVFLPSRAARRYRYQLALYAPPERCGHCSFSAMDGADRGARLVHQRSLAQPHLVSSVQTAGARHALAPFGAARRPHLRSAQLHERRTGAGCIAEAGLAQAPIEIFSARPGRLCVSRVKR